MKTLKEKAITFIEKYSPKDEATHTEEGWNYSFYNPIIFCNDCLPLRFQKTWKKIKKNN